MFCTGCGQEFAIGDRYCSQCGRSTAPPPAAPGKRLGRSMWDAKVAGVCSGFAHYLGMDVTLMRLLFIAAVFLSAGTAVVAYFIAWALMPKLDRPPAATGLQRA